MSVIFSSHNFNELFAIWKFVLFKNEFSRSLFFSIEFLFRDKGLCHYCKWSFNCHGNIYNVTIYCVPMCKIKSVLWREINRMKWKQRNMIIKCLRVEYVRSIGCCFLWRSVGIVIKFSLCLTIEFRFQTFQRHERWSFSHHSTQCTTFKYAWA